VGDFIIKHYAENAYTDKWDGDTIDVEVIARGE
jgi:hypothetical protein